MTELTSIFRDRVRERDLDNFLVEELRASESFRQWFLSRLPSEFETGPSGEIQLHKSPPRAQDSRQTDVRLGWFSGQALVACVLIESKVTADFQPGQAEAYRAEVIELRSQLGVNRACAVIVAPIAKLRALSAGEIFDAEISIEEIAQTLRDRRNEGLEAELDARLDARIDLLEALAGKRNASDWQPVTVQSKRDFANLYAQLALEVVPSLRVKPSSDGPKAITRFFEGFALPIKFPCSVALKHEFGTGEGFKYANLQFSGQADKFPQVAERSDMFDETIYPIASGKSLFVRVDTPAIRPSVDEFEIQRERLVIGLNGVATLAGWIATHGDALAQLLAPPKSPLDLGKAFEAALRELADRAWSECSYRPSYFLEMLDGRGGGGAAHALLAGRPSDGFTRLWELKRLDLSVEAIALQEPWRELFSDSELRMAERRLKDAGYIK